MTEKERIEEFEAIVEQFIPAEMKKYMVKHGFFSCPASSRFHGAYEGGLYEHSRNVLDQLLGYQKLGLVQFQEERSPYVVGWLHDLCKLDLYRREEEHYVHTDDLLLPGHGEKSVMLAGRFMRLTEEEMLCIRYHMGAYEKDVWDFFGRAVKKYPSVLWTHQADMVASKILESDADKADAPADQAVPLVKKSDGKKKPEEKKAKKTRTRIDYGKIMALKKAGWDNEKIAEEMGMTKESVAGAVCRYKKKMETITGNG